MTFSQKKYIYYSATFYAGPDPSQNSGSKNKAEARGKSPKRWEIVLEKFVPSLKWKRKGEENHQAWSQARPLSWPSLIAPIRVVLNCVETCPWSLLELCKLVAIHTSAHNIVLPSYLALSHLRPFHVKTIIINLENKKQFTEFSLSLSLLHLWHYVRAEQKAVVHSSRTCACLLLLHSSFISLIWMHIPIRLFFISQSRLFSTLKRFELKMFQWERTQNEAPVGTRVATYINTKRNTKFPPVFFYGSSRLTSTPAHCKGKLGKFNKRQLWKNASCELSRDSAIVPNCFAQNCSKSLHKAGRKKRRKTQGNFSFPAENSATAAATQRGWLQLVITQVNWRYYIQRTTCRSPACPANYLWKDIELRPPTDRRTDRQMYYVCIK